MCPSRVKPFCFTNLISQGDNSPPQGRNQSFKLKPDPRVGKSPACLLFLPECGMWVRKAGVGVPLPFLVPNRGWEHSKIQTRQRGVLRTLLLGGSQTPSLNF